MDNLPTGTSRGFQSVPRRSTPLASVSEIGEYKVAVACKWDINATRAAVNAAKESIVYPFEARVEQLREEFRSLKQHIDESIENAVANTVVKILQEYGVLDEVMNLINKVHLNLNLKQLGLLN